MVALRREEERYISIAPVRVERRRPAVRPRGALLPLVRKDMLPENVPYTDTGCDLFASCLRCPLARCRYDEPPGGLRRLVTEAETSCRDADEQRAAANARAAMELLKFLP